MSGMDDIHRCLNAVKGFDTEPDQWLITVVELLELSGGMLIFFDEPDIVSATYIASDDERTRRAIYKAQNMVVAAIEEFKKLKDQTGG